MLVPGVGVLRESSKFDPVPRKASVGVHTSSLHSTTIALDDSDSLVTVVELGEAVDLGGWISTLTCSTWLSLPPGDASFVC